MNSIWIEDEPKDHPDRFHINSHAFEMLNSDTPVLHSKNTIELPPLPPSSYFQSLQQDQGKAQSNKGLVKMFKKLSFNSKDKDLKPRRKISTPFGFSHVSHINQETPITNNSFQIPVNLEDETPVSVERSLSSHGVSFNTTSPQLDPIFSPAKKNNHPRTISNSNSINSSLFQRTASISTMATSVSGRSRKHSSQFNIVLEPALKKQTSPPSNNNDNNNINNNYNNNKHTHSNSLSSIENLKKFEQDQISKQCSIDYTSNTKNEKSFEAWETPDLGNAGRQSWIYGESSPFVPKLNYSPEDNNTPTTIGRPTLKNSKSMNFSPSCHYNNSPLLRHELNLFQNEMEISFKSEFEYKKVSDTIDQFKKNYHEVSPISERSTRSEVSRSSISNLRSSRYTFQNQILDLDMKSDTEDELFNETIASLRAAKFTRMSRLENFHHQDTKWNSFNISTSSSSSSPNTSELVEEEEEEEEEVAEIFESTPTQHKIGVLLPSVLD